MTEARDHETALLALNLDAAARWPQFAAALAEAAGSPVGYHTSGTVMVARDHDDLAAFARLAEVYQDAHLTVERLGSRALRRLEPRLATTVRGGFLVPGDHQVDNRALLGALRTACDRAGVTMRQERVRAVRSGQGRVTGVTLAGGDQLNAEQVVLAAGAGSGRVDGLPTPPVRPVKGQLVHLRGPADEPLVEHVLRGLEVYVVPRPDGRLVVGATVEEVGFDTTVTAGGVAELLVRAEELLPDVAELELVETVAGLRPGSPDNAPLIGPGALDGLIVATGHFRHGVLLAPVTADAVVGLLTGGQVPPLVAPFDPGRFGRGGGVT